VLVIGGDSEQNASFALENGSAATFDDELEIMPSTKTYKNRSDNPPCCKHGNFC